MGRAAQRLHVSQPPLTRSIRSLEDELGTALFQRTPRGMRLLPAGATFLLHARRILGEVDAAIEAVAGLPEAEISPAEAARGASCPGSSPPPR